MTGARVGRREALLVAIVAVAVAAYEYPIAADDLAGPAAWFGLTWALCVALLVTSGAGGLYRPCAAYVILFGLFHGGLLVSVALRGTDELTVTELSWLYSGYTVPAVRLAILGLAAFTVVAELVTGRVRGRPRDHPPAPPAVGGFAVIGLGVEFLGVAAFGGAVAQAGGLDVLRGGYTTFLEANESAGLLGYGTLGIGFGAVLAVIAGGAARTTAWLTFAGYALVALLVGTRGAVLFALLALLAVEVRRGLRIRAAWTVLGIPCVLAVIGLVRTARQAGFAVSAGSVWTAPLDAIAEMGASLRPAVAVLGWHAAGEPWLHGLTLVAVPLRFVEALTGWHGGAPGYDERLFNVEILQRVGPIGGSPVAEGYHNGGLFGVLLFLAAVGAVLGWLESRPSAPFADAVVGIVLLALLIQVRNSFAPVPVQLMLGFLLLVAVRFVDRWAVVREPEPVSGA